MCTIEAKRTSFSPDLEITTTCSYNYYRWGYDTFFHYYDHVGYYFLGPIFFLFIIRSAQSPYVRFGAISGSMSTHSLGIAMLLAHLIAALWAASGFFSCGFDRLRIIMARYVLRGGDGEAAAEAGDGEPSLWRIFGIIIIMSGMRVGLSWYGS